MSFLRDSVSTFVAQALQAAGQLVVGVILARVLLAEGRGEYGLLVLIPTTAVVVAGLGFGTAALRQVAKDRTIAAAVATNAAWVALATSLVTTAILWCARAPISAFIGAGTDTTALELALCAIPLLVVDQYVALFLTGVGAIRASNAIKLLQTALLLGLLPLFFAWNGRNVASAMWAWTLSFVAQDAVAIAFVIRRSAPALRVDRRLLREALSFGLRSFPASLAMFLLFRSDLFLVRASRGLDEVGVYSLATSLALLFQLFGRAIERAFIPRIMARSASDAALLTPQVTRTFVLVLTPVATVAALASSFAVPWLFGAAFSDAALVFALFLPGMVIANVGVLCNGDILSRGHPATGSTAAVVCLAANVTANLMWIPRFGIFGAACSSLACYALYGMWIALAYRRLTGVTLRQLFVPTAADARALSALVRPQPSSRR